jgi:hypothetical protein
MPWFHMIRWLHGDLRGASEEMTNASVVVNLVARGAIVSEGQVHGKTQGAPANWMEI